MSTVSESRYITLPGGPTLPLEPVLLVLALEAQGLDLSRDGDSIVVRPSGRLTDGDRAALTRWKSHVLALIDHVDSGGVQ